MSRRKELVSMLKSTLPLSKCSQKKADKETTPNSPKCCNQINKFLELEKTSNGASEPTFQCSIPTIESPDINSSGSRSESDAGRCGFIDKTKFPRGRGKRFLNERGKELKVHTFKRANSCNIRTRTLRRTISEVNETGSQIYTNKNYTIGRSSVKLAARENLSYNTNESIKNSHDQERYEYCESEMAAVSENRFTVQERRLWRFPRGSATMRSYHIQGSQFLNFESQPIYTTNCRYNVKEKPEWNKKTEDFLRKLKNMESLSSEVQREPSHWNKKQKRISKRSCSRNSSLSPTTKRITFNTYEHVQSATPASTGQLPNDVDRKDLKHKRQSSETKSRHDARCNVADNFEIDRVSICETIRALEREIYNLERKRHIMALRSPNKHTKMILASVLKMQQEMKDHIIALKEVVSRMSAEEKFVEQRMSVGAAHKAHLENETLLPQEHSRSKDDLHSPLKDESSPKSLLHAHSRHEHRKETDRSRDSKLLEADEKDIVEGMKDTVDSSIHSKIPAGDDLCNIQNEDAPKDNNSQSAQASSSLSSFGDNIEPLDQQNLLKGAISEGIEHAMSLFLTANQFYDGGNLWCQPCDVLCSDILELSQHLHSQVHFQKSEFEECAVISTKKKNTSDQSAPARGDEFIKPLKAFYCYLCGVVCRDTAALQEHFTSESHNNKFKEFLTRNQSYEMPYLTKKLSAIFKIECAADDPKVSKQRNLSNETTTVSKNCDLDAFGRPAGRKEVAASILLCI